MLVVNDDRRAPPAHCRLEIILSRCWPTVEESPGIACLEGSVTLSPDRFGLFSLAESFPDQLMQAVKLAPVTFPPWPFGKTATPKRVLVSAMGGSAIGAELVGTAVGDLLQVPLLVNRSPSVPPWLGPADLHIVVTYSGHTKETLAAFRAGLQRGVSTLVITSGEKLLAEVQSIVIGGFRRLGWIRIPSGIPPRCALGYTSLPVLRILEMTRLLPDMSHVIRLTIASLKKARERWEAGSPLADNEAKQLALAFQGRIPFIYGVSGLTGPVARRWKCQLNENSGIPASWDELPEIAHNEIQGWIAGTMWEKGVTTLLTTSYADSLCCRQERALMDLADRFGIPLGIVSVKGGSPLEQVFLTTYLGDYTSLYLACLLGKDPGEIALIRAVKEHLDD